MALEVTGKIVEVGPTMQVSERFKKREFILDITEEVNGNSYPNFAKLQAVQNRCELLDNFVPGDVIKCSFNIRGNKWEKDGKVNYITALDAWRIEGVPQVGTNSGQYQSTAAPAQWEQRAQQPAQAQQPTQTNAFNTPGAGAAGSADDLPF